MYTSKYTECASCAHTSHHPQIPPFIYFHRSSICRPVEAFMPCLSKLLKQVCGVYACCPCWQPQPFIFSAVISEFTCSYHQQCVCTAAADVSSPPKGDRITVGTKETCLKRRNGLSLSVKPLIFRELKTEDTFNIRNQAYFHILKSGTACGKVQHNNNYYCCRSYFYVTFEEGYSFQH